MHTNITIKLRGRGEIRIVLPSAHVSVSTGENAREDTARLWLAREEPIRGESPVEVLLFPTAAHFFEALFRWTRTKSGAPLAWEIEPAALDAKVCSTPGGPAVAQLPEEAE